MPGTVVAVHVADGDDVEAGQTIVTVEAMKMEHRITAPISGRVTRRHQRGRPRPSRRRRRDPSHPIATSETNETS